MELDTTFYVLGGVLVALALIVSYIGVKGKDKFPPSKGVMAGGLLLVGVVVVATAGYAVALAEEEQEHREHEQAEEEAHAEEEASTAQQGAAPAAQGEQGPGSPGGKPQTAGAGASLAVSSPADGGFAFDPPDLQAAAGNITIAFDNPSPVPHNIFLQDEEDTVITQSEDVTGGTVEISAELTPGEYIYYCAIPGHREGGMEGVLTVE